MHAARARNGSPTKLELFQRKEETAGMPPSLKRRLTGNRAADSDYWHARRDGSGRNAPPWSPEGGLAAVEMLEVVRVSGATEVTMEEAVFNLFCTLETSGRNL